MSEGEWSYENLLSDNAMYRERISALEKVAEAAATFRKSLKVRTHVHDYAVALNELDDLLRAAGYLKEQGNEY